MTPETFPLSKVCDITGDAPVLAAYLTQLETAEACAGQHPIRQWEYAMAAAAVDRWDGGVWHADPPLQIMDVGGAGSGLWRALRVYTPAPIVTVDPHAPPSVEAGHRTLPLSVEQVAAQIAPGLVDVITCISVIEHVVDVPPFLKALRTLLRRGGLLVLTTDYWDQDGPDTAHFHWMRERIYNPERIAALWRQCVDAGFVPFGRVESTYHGPQIYGYSIASLTLVAQ